MLLSVAEGQENYKQLKQQEVDMSHLEVGIHLININSEEN